MRDETPELDRPLRHGYTTGACATACATAAAHLLLTGDAVESVQITLPRGQHVDFALTHCQEQNQGAEAGTIKDAGDDPDVTHGAQVRVWVLLEEEPGVRFEAGPGVGTITRTGLSLPPGEPAINPVPRKMITEHLLQQADAVAYQGGFKVTIGIDGGAALAEKTLNGRLGIVGGLSILGTTGIVKPFSCSAYIASIHRAIDVAKANGHEHLAACTGSRSETAMQNELAIADMALIEMGDFVGAVLKYLKRHPVEQLSLCGGFAKLCKLAQGHMDLHSRSSRVDFEFLAELAQSANTAESVLEQIRSANTAQQALELCPALADVVCEKALGVCRERLPALQLNLYAINREGTIVGRASS